MYALFFLRFPLWLWMDSNWLHVQQNEKHKLLLRFQFASIQALMSLHLKPDKNLKTSSWRSVSTGGGVHACEDSNACVFALFRETCSMWNRSQAGVLQRSSAEPHYNFSIRGWLKSGATTDSETLQPMGAFLIIPFGSRGSYKWETVMNGTALQQKRGVLNLCFCWGS